MRHPHDPNARTRAETLRASFIMLLFGFGILAFLVAIDRPEWFHIRPISGTAAAMSKASTASAAESGTATTRTAGA